MERDCPLLLSSCYECLPDSSHLKAEDLILIQRDFVLRLTAASDLDSILNLSLETAFRTSGMDCGCIYFYNSAARSLELACQKGLKTVLDGKHFPLCTESFSLECILKGKPTFTQFSHLPHLGKYGTSSEKHHKLRALAVLPVLHGKKAIGCMNIASHTLDELSPLCQTVLETISTQMGNHIVQWKSKKKLKKAEMHLTSLFESATNFALYRVGNDGKNRKELQVVFVSPSIKEIMGISEPMKYEKWFENTHPEDVPRITKANEKAFETFKFDEVMRIYHPKKKMYRWIKAISTGIPHENGTGFWADGILFDDTERMTIMEILQKRDANLKTKGKALEEANIALRVLLKKWDEEKEKVQERALFRMRKSIEPYLARMKALGLNTEQLTFLSMIESNMKNISSLSKGMGDHYFDLTPREAQVAILVREGTSTKEIACVLDLTEGTIQSYRENIRRKLGIKNRNTNLRAHLASLL